MSMVLRFYNTLTRGKHAFAPIDPANVRLYVCGPTVYDRAHIGNGRAAVVFDLLFRLLRHVYDANHVTYVRNITDVDDKINARAFERGVSIRELTETTAGDFMADVAALNCLTPTVQPRATDHMAEMIEITTRLIASGHAYEADGHVLFSVPSLPDYGALSRRPLDEMIAGARVDVAPYKRSDADFVLWKPAADEGPGWASPWGRGRPGWHIECSAMSWKHLGEVFDIHGGGIDLVFPHHENELAQSRCAFGHEVMARVWMHNGFLQVEGEKMSKSLGNFVTIHDLLASAVFGGRRWPGEAMRFSLLRSHYRQPMDWTVSALEEAERTLDRWYGFAESLADATMAEPGVDFLEALTDDLNTPAALAEIHRLFAAGDTAAAVASARLLGFLESTPGSWRRGREAQAGIDPDEIETLIAARRAARTARDWTESDRIRDVLAARAIVLKDNKDGTTTWIPALKGTP